MINITEWGEVISSNLSMEEYGEMDIKAHSFTYGENRILEGQIVRLIPKDEKENRVKRFTLYEVNLFYPEGAGSGPIKAIAAQPFFGGGFNNFCEVIPPSPGQNAQDDSIDQGLKPGTRVVVGFLGGMKSAPVILGSLPHYSAIATATRPTKDKGPGYLEAEFQGVNYSVDKNGAFKLKWTGPKTEKGKPVDEKLGPTELSIDKSGSVEIKTNQKQSVKIDRVAKTIKVTSGKSSITLTQAGEKLEIVCTDVSLKAEGKARVEVKGDAAVVVKGALDLSSAKSIELQKEEPATEPYVLGNKLVEFLNELMAQQLAIANALGNLGVPTPPIIQGPAIGAMTSKLQSLLSKHIKGV